jgi:chemotaxis signal transduction protein
MQDVTKFHFGIVKIGQTFLGLPIHHLSEVFPVDSEQHLPQAGGPLRAGVALRERLIPVLNLQTLADLSYGGGPPKFGVVIEHKQQLLAILVDEIIGITSITADAINDVSNGSSEPTSPFQRAFYRDGAFVSLIDVEFIFSHPDVSTVRQPEITTKKSERDLKPVLTFEAGSALFSIPAVEVYAAIPKQKIARTAIAMGPCLGEITYHGRRIPVVCPAQILGLGQRNKTNLTEVVALRFPGDLVLGLAVDAIHKIGTVATGTDTTIPVWHAKRNFIEKVVIRDDKTQIFAISLPQLHAAKDLNEIASLSKPDDVPLPDSIIQTSKTQNMSREKSRYLVVEATDRLAIPLTHVNRIVEPPEELTTTDQSQHGFRGYFARFNESIALYDLSECMGRPPVDVATSKILLTGQPGHLVGFMVDRVVSIEMSEWSETPRAGATPGNTTLVQLGDGPEAMVLPSYSLHTAVTQITAAAH